jgi:hypothetical protein
VPRRRYLGSAVLAARAGPRPTSPGFLHLPGPAGQNGMTCLWPPRDQGAAVPQSLVCGEPDHEVLEVGAHRAGAGGPGSSVGPLRGPGRPLGARPIVGARGRGGPRARLAALNLGAFRLVREGATHRSGRDESVAAAQGGRRTTVPPLLAGPAPL